MVCVREIIPFYGRTIQVSELLQFAQISDSQCSLVFFCDLPNNPLLNFLRGSTMFFPPRIKAGVFDLSHPKNEPSDEAKDLIRHWAVENLWFKNLA